MRLVDPLEAGAASKPGRARRSGWAATSGGYRTLDGHRFAAAHPGWWSSRRRAAMALKRWEIFRQNRIEAIVRGQ